MRWMEPRVPWGCSHTGATHAALEPPSSISVSNAWLFVTLCVRCGASVWRELRPRGASGGRVMVMGARGTLGGNPSSHHCSRLGGWLGPGGEQKCPWALLLLL